MPFLSLERVPPFPSVLAGRCNIGKTAPGFAQQLFGGRVHSARDWNVSKSLKIGKDDMILIYIITHDAQHQRVVVTILP